MILSYSLLFTSLFGFSFYISPTIAGSDLCVLFKSSPQYKTLTSDQQRCTAGNVSPAWTFYSCEEKACFCNDPTGIDDRLMKCVLRYITGDPLDAYNGAMYFYATECGSFQFQKKEYLSQSMTFENTYPTTAPAANPDPGAGVQAIPTADTTTDKPAPTSTKTGDSGQGSTENQQSSNPDLSVGGIIGIVAGVCTVLALFVAIYMCLCR